LARDGRGFSYVNPLQVRTEHRDPVERGARRQPWYEVACCPPNVMRLLATLEHYLATSDSRGVQLHQYAPSRLGLDVPDAGRVELEVATDYPWQGGVDIQVMHSPEQPWTLTLRVPSWASGFALTVNGEPCATADAPDGYLHVERHWAERDRVVLDLPMEPRLLAPHPRIDAVRGCVAIERGPLVYCIEEADQPEGAIFEDLAIDCRVPLASEPAREPLAAAVAVKAAGVHAPADAWPQPWPYSSARPMPEIRSAEITAVPYASWGNRDEGAMRVWIPAWRSDGAS